MRISTKSLRSHQSLRHSIDGALKTKASSFLQKQEEMRSDFERQSNFSQNRDSLKFLSDYKNQQSIKLIKRNSWNRKLTE